MNRIKQAVNGHPWRALLAILTVGVLAVHLVVPSVDASSLKGPLDISGTHVFNAYLSAIAAADATADHTIFVAPAAGRVTRVIYVPSVANTGQASNYHTLQVLNRTTAGLGTGQLGSDLAYSSSGVADVAAVARDLFNSTTDADAVLTTGSVVVIKHLKTGNGVALSGGLIQVYFQPK